MRRNAKNAGNRQETRQNRLLTDTIAETMLLYRLPIIGSYTAGNAGNVFRLFKSKTDRRNTGQHTETADQNAMLTVGRRKCINHSGAIGYSESRFRKITDNRQITTGWRHRTRIVINVRQFQNSVQPIFKSWRNRKRGTLYVRTRKASAGRKSAETA